MLDTSVTIFSEKFFSILEKENAAGWGQFPVCLETKSGESCGDYGGIVVHGRAGRIEDSLSPRACLLPKFSGGPSMPVLVGRLFKPETWDGRDVFFLEGTTVLVVTHRVKEALSREHLKGVSFTRLDLETRYDHEMSSWLREKGYYTACRTASDHRVLRNFL